MLKALCFTSTIILVFNFGFEGFEAKSLVLVVPIHDDCLCFTSSVQSFMNLMEFFVLGLLYGLDERMGMPKSYDVRKPVSWVSDQVRHKSSCTSTEDG